MKKDSCFKISESSRGRGYLRRVERYRVALTVGHFFDLCRARGKFSY